MSLVGLRTNLDAVSDASVSYCPHRSGILHLADSFVDIDLPWQVVHLARCQFQQSRVTLLGRNLRLDHVDLLLSLDGARLDLLYELMFIMLEVL